MNESSKSIEASSTSEDRRVVAEYLASDAYRRAKRRPKRTPLPNQTSKWPVRELSPTTSFVLGLVGLSGLLVLFGLAAPVLSEGLEEVLDASNHYLVFTVLEQAMVLPAVFVFAFATVTPMFWYGSVLLRFTLAAILTLPGCYLYIAESRLHPTAALATFLVIAAVAVLIQMWSRWKLSHSRQIDSPLSPTGTRSIMELTVVTALGCFALLSVDTGDEVESVLFSMAVGFCSAVAVLAVMIALLRPIGRNPFAACMATLFAFAASFGLAGMRAFSEFGWQQLPSMLPSLFAASLTGLVVFALVAWLCIGWLRVCGWICLSRQEERQVRAANEDWPQHWYSEATPDPLGER